QALGDDAGRGVGENVGLIAAIQAHDNYYVPGFSGGLDLGAGHERDGLDVSYFHAIDLNGSAVRKTGNLRLIRFQAVLRPQKITTCDIENAGRQHEKADQHEETYTQFR